MTPQKTSDIRAKFGETFDGPPILWRCPVAIAPKDMLPGVLMSDADRDRDDAFRKMIQAFEQMMNSVHGFTFEEARMVTQGELQREYARRAEARRLSFRLIDCSE